MFRFFKEAPLTVVYDFGCAAEKYVMTREPRYWMYTWWVTSLAEINTDSRRI
jgi:hypothetical protein